MKQVVRIIGGLYRGKKLHFPDVEGLRPTPDRVRETLFNWLMHNIRETNCLDAFAGSGALGLEAFSRGAAQVFFLEQSPQAYANLHKTISTFNSSKLKLLKTDALEYLEHSKENFDIIFLDPPFAQNFLPQCMSYLAQSPVLKSGGLVYLESATAIHLDEHHWRQIKLKQAGQVLYGLFEKRN
ncbi:MAG: 16S rRNA (guanine(966)-N(2))-methyltransferase RsmD [Legionella longbeachae]|nr:16S rRNA (guanine(966)-N(2))-methyltransferase RsmD [Legionella longbeachae]